MFGTSFPPRPHVLPSLFWAKLINSRALYCYDNAERREVDSVDFIVSHFHMSGGAEEAFDLHTYLCTAHKLHGADVRTCTELLVRSSTTRPHTDAGTLP